jgi:hypothetical protein
MLALTGAALIAASAPAAAQYGYDFYQDRIERIGQRLETGIRDGRINRSESYRLRTELRNLRRLERQHRIGGFSQPERTELQGRIDFLDRRVREAIQNRNYPGRPYDRDFDIDDRYDRNNDGIDDRYDRDLDGYDDRYDRDRDGYRDRYDRDQDGYDDRYERDRGADPDFSDVPRSRRYGAGDQLPSSYNVYNVPVEYQSRYRDNVRYYYRFDGRAIYEVDRATGRITRVIDAR